MASQNSAGSSGSRRSVSHGFQLRCYHDEIAPLRTVKYNGPTKGKRFYGCSYWPEQRTCGFFKWIDEVDEVRHLQSIVNEKNDRIHYLEEKVRNLKAKKGKLEDEVAEMGIATTETLWEMKESNTDKRLILCLVFSWCFFTLVLLFK